MPCQKPPPSSTTSARFGISPRTVRRAGPSGDTRALRRRRRPAAAGTAPGCARRRDRARPQARPRPWRRRRAARRRRGGRARARGRRRSRAAPRASARRPRAAADRRRRPPLEEHDVVPGLGGDARRLEPGRAAARDDDAAALGIPRRAGAHSASRPSRGLIVQVTPPAYRRQSCTMPMHGRIRPTCPRAPWRPTPGRRACRARRRRSRPGPASSARSASAGQADPAGDDDRHVDDLLHRLGEPEREALVPARVLDVAPALPVVIDR